MKIYSRKGDKGKTDLIGKTKVSKDDFRIEALGTIDELNSLLGLTTCFLPKKDQRTTILKSIQKDLIEISSLLASPKQKKGNSNLKEKIKLIEKTIDQKTKKLPLLKKFVTPGSGKENALLHLSRTVARRAERRVATLSKKEKINPEILTYLNRLSDLLFVLAMKK